MYWLILLIPIVIFIYWLYLIFKSQRYWKKRGIVCIKRWPLIVHFIKNRSLSGPFQEIYNQYPDEKFIGFHQFNSPVLMIRDPDLIKLVTIKHFDSFMNHRVILTEDIDPLFGKNLLSLKGQKWKDMRSTLSPAFTSSKMRTMYELIKECAEQFTLYFLKEAENDNKMVSVEMKDIFSRYTNDIIASTAFGIKCDSLKNKTNEFYMTGKKCTNQNYLSIIKIIGYLLMMPIMKFLGVKIFGKEVDSFFRNIIKTTIAVREKHHIIRPDMIHLLMEARKGRLKHENSNHVEEETGFATVQESNLGKISDENKSILTDDDITAQAILFFLAGYQTSSIMMSFLSYEVAINPEIQKKLHDEIEETLQKFNGKIDYDSLLKMKYLDMVICESLRKWPPAGMTERICEKPYSLTVDGKSVQLDANVSVWMPVYSLHHDPKYFAEPEKFDPERFSDDNKKNIIPFTYLPFGSGPRNCIGSRFALLEIKTLFVHLLSKFELTVIEKTQIPLKMQKAPVNMVPEKGIWLGLKSRK